MARWALIAGPKKSNKSQRALELVERLRKAGFSVAGFVQVREVGDDDLAHIDILRLATGDRAVVAKEQLHSRPGDDVTFCNLRFQPDAFGTARQWLEEDASGAEVVFIGDINKLEVSGQGHHGATTQALALPRTTLAVVCVSADQLFYVVEKFGLEDECRASLELPASEEACQEFYDAVVNDAAAHRHKP